MTNEYYNDTGNPLTASSGSSALMRAQFSLIEDAFDLFPDLSTNANKIFVVNATGDGVDAVSTLTGGIGLGTLTSGGILLGAGTDAITAMNVLADGEIVIGDGVTAPTTLSAFSSSSGTLKAQYGGLGFDASTIQVNQFLAGTGAGAIGIKTASEVKTILGFPLSGAADGTISIGDGSADPTTVAAFTSSSGTLKHEYGGLEQDISAVTDGDMIVGNATGSVRLEDIYQIKTRLSFLWIFDTLNDLETSANVTTAQIGQRMMILGRYAPNDGGGNIYEILAAGSQGAEDNGSVIDFLNTQGRGVFPGGRYLVEHWGAGDSSYVADNTTAFQACIDYCESNGVRMETLSKTYPFVVGGLTVGTNQFQFVGSGSARTIFSWTPSADGTFFTINRNAICSYGRLEGFSIYSDDDNYVKTAMDLYSVDAWAFEDIKIYGGVSNGSGSVIFGSPQTNPSTSTGNGSIGIHLHGHQASHFTNVFLFADRPIVLSKNPNTFLDLDHFSFRNMFYIGNQFNPIIEGDISDSTGTRNITELTLDGYQAAVNGKGFFKWDVLSGSAAYQSTVTGVSQKIVFNNVRHESSVVFGSEYVYKLTHNVGFQGIELNNCHWGDKMNGIYGRALTTLALNNHISENSVRHNFNLDGTVRVFKVENSLLNGPVGTLTDLRLVGKSQMNVGAGGGAIGPNFIYESGVIAPTNDNLYASDYADGGYELILDDTDVYGLSSNNEMLGLLEIINNDPGAFRGYMSVIVRGTTQTVTIESDAFSLLSTTKSTSSKINVYYDVSNARYEVENQTGSQIRARVKFVGTYNGI